MNWTPKFYASVDVDAEDTDYLRDIDCCAGCGAYMGDLPGYWFIEDSDSCPICRAANNEESCGQEVGRIMIRCEEPQEDIDSTLYRLQRKGI